MLTRFLDRRVSGEAWRNVIAFWFMGLFNNSSYVIMIAGAKHISSGGVALVYIANVVPSFMVKLTLPYWFDLMGYTTRLWLCQALMVASFCLVAFGSGNVYLQLTGVALTSLMSGIGEASFLALTHYYNTRTTLTAWSSGTGFAGIFGFAWIVIFNRWLGFGFSTTIMFANVLPLGWLTVYYSLLDMQHCPENISRLPTMRTTNKNAVSAKTESSKSTSLATNDSCLSPQLQLSPLYYRMDVDDEMDNHSTGSNSSTESSSDNVEVVESQGAPNLPVAIASPGSKIAQIVARYRQDSIESHYPGESLSRSSSVASSGYSTTSSDAFSGSGDSLSFRARLRYIICHLWPYIIPLMLVYFAEYAMQSGVWAAIGFPVDDKLARERFYTNAGWSYQAGVFVSRSSGILFQSNRKVLWAMPLLQCALLAFFWLDAVQHFWYDESLLVMCFITGLLGGAVYVNAFTLISKEQPRDRRELALSAASIGDSLGIIFADVAGLFIQACLYRHNGIVDATKVQCPAGW